MSCRKFARELALEVEGDLPAPRSRALAGHLESCEACRRLAVELRESQAWIKALGGAPLEEGALGAIRSAVLSRLEAEPKRARRWRWALAPMAASLIVMAVGVLHQPRSVVAPPRPPAPHAALAISTGPLAASASRVPTVRRRARPAAAQRPPAPAAQPMLVRFTVGEPEIVIYWIFDQEGS